MRVRPFACDRRRLELFLLRRLPDDFQKEVEAHLAACPDCRDRLDELAGGPRWWSDVRKYLSDDDDFSLSPEQTLDFLKPSDDPAVLGRLGPYEVQEVIGRGGMGVVLKAFDPALHRPVAIKVLAAEYAANGAARKRFAREARAAAAVVHEHVVPVHAVDADASPPYLVMAYLPGRSLQERIDRDGPLELKEILRIGFQAASGLAAAHAQGLVHRDIKPANIMLENGVERVRLTDFGLARAVDDASVTQTGSVAGTPQYMAPEQGRGDPVDQRADLFSLGSTLYAMCTGRAPFRGDSAVAVVRQVCDAEPVPIRELNPDIPAWLEGIIRTLHAKDPAKRYASAAVVADLLERCLAHVQQPDQHPLPPEVAAWAQPVRKRVRPRERWLAAGGLLVGVLATAAALMPRPVRQDEPGRDAAPQAAAPVLTDAEARDVARFPELLAEWQRTALQVERSLTAGHASVNDPIEDELTDVRMRLELLRRQMDPNNR